MTRQLTKFLVTAFASLFLLFCSEGKAQTYTTNNSFSAVVKISSYYYSQNVYVVYNPYPEYSMSDLWSKALNTLQARYDYAHNILSTEYNKLLNLELVNDFNIKMLDGTRKAIIAYTEPNYTKVDFSDYNNFSSWLNYFTIIYAAPSIRQEISLLGSVNKELNRIKFKDPDNFYKTERYQSLSTVVTELKTINKDSISTLAWKYGLL